MIGFTAVLEAADRGGALVVVPAEVVDAIGGGGRIPVVAEFADIRYRGSIVTYSGRKVLGVLETIREELGVGPGDEIEVRVERDTTEREVVIPTELAKATEQCEIIAVGPRDTWLLTASSGTTLVRWVELLSPAGAREPHHGGQEARNETPSGRQDGAEAARRLDLASDGGHASSTRSNSSCQLAVNFSTPSLSRVSTTSS